jgi:undecaprenyl-diphosphatase
MKAKNIIGYSIGILLFVASFFIDNFVLDKISLVRNPILDFVLGAVTHFGSVFIVMIIMTSLFMWEERKREWIPVLLTSFVVSTAICLMLKYTIARPRPSDFSALVALTAYSFPSLHSSASFTAVPILDLEFPMFKWFWILFAVVVGFSRIYLNVHYLSDVIGGALIGFATAHLFVFIEKKYKLFRKIKLFK